MAAKREAEILADYELPGKPQINGVTHDGKNAWVALGDHLQAIAPDGTPGRSLPVRAPAGTAFDGKHFYQIADQEVRKIDPATGEVVAVIPAPSAGCAGLTWAEGALWIAHYQSKQILKLDPKTGAVLRTVQSDRFVTGVTFADGELWHGADEDGKGALRRIDAESGEVRETLTMPSGAYVSGLEYDGESKFYAGGGKSGRLRVVRRPNRA